MRVEIDGRPVNATRYGKLTSEGDAVICAKCDRALARIQEAKARLQSRRSLVFGEDWERRGDVIAMSGRGMKRLPVRHGKRYASREGEAINRSVRSGGVRFTPAGWFVQADGLPVVVACPREPRGCGTLNVLVATSLGVGSFPNA